jgi:hypothetical protein
MEERPLRLGYVGAGNLARDHRALAADRGLDAVTVSAAYALWRQR